MLDKYTLVRHCYHDGGAWKHETTEQELETYEEVEAAYHYCLKEDEEDNCGDWREYHVLVPYTFEDFQQNFS